MSEKLLFHEDFGGIPQGQFSAPVGPHTEYHFLPEAAPKYGWAVACFTSWNATNTKRMDEAWEVGEDAGGCFLRQSLDNKATHSHPMVIRGEPEWRDYRIVAEVVAEDLRGFRGIVFRYHNNRCYYAFGFTETRLLIKRVEHERDFHVPFEVVLAEAPWSAKEGERLSLEILCEGPRVTAKAGGITVSSRDEAYAPMGKLGLMADYPTRFYSIKASIPDSTFHSIQVSVASERKALEALRERYPKPVLWKQAKTPGFGVGRNLRFGDLTGNGVPDILVTQVLHHGPRDAYSECGCITAMTVDGEILWQSGKPDPERYHLTNDVGVQIHDIDGDGTNEVVYCRDFELVIADGRTGKIKNKVPTPKATPDAGKFERILGDCLFFCDFRGLGRAGDIVVKDRYWNFWVYDDKLEFQWTGKCRTGHYPYACDIDGDGKDELAIGYAVFDHDGTLQWNNQDSIPDHVDGVAVLDFSMEKGAAPVLFYAGSDAGITYVDCRGKILKRHLIGHAQNPVIGRFRDDIPGLQAVAINFWGNQGILHFLDRDGNIYKDAEPLNMGSMCLPCNWTGEARELFLLNPSVEYGGLYDGWARPVVLLPDDGHPVMCNAVLDFTGDCRDEIVVWDQQELWIYTQSDNPKPGILYKPVRNRRCNDSNYQATVSLPGWHIPGGVKE